MTPTTPPRGVFQGRNFMTPNWIGYFKLKQGYAELSHGRGIQDEPIFGVTVRKGDGSHFDPERSKLFWTKQAALSYIGELS